MRFLLSGASSIFTLAVAESLRSSGHDVRLIGRTSSPAFTLENPTESLADLLEEYEYFVHFAHSFTKQQIPDLNYEAAVEIARMFEEKKVKKCIYVSSDSASRESNSRYGQSKYRCEQVFLRNSKSLVLRVGIILDEAIPSPFQIIRTLVKRTSFLIVGDLNVRRFTSITIEEFTKNLLDVCTRDLTGGPFSAKAQPLRLSLPEVLLEVGVNPKVRITLPGSLVLRVARLMRKLGIFTKQSDSILSVVSPPELINGLER